MPNDSTQSAPTPTAPGYGLLTQLTTGPSSREVASNLLREALAELYPKLNLNPDFCMLVTPRWQVTEQALERGEPQVESLTSILARQALMPKPLVYIEGEHYLTLQPNVRSPVHLPVAIDAIARLMNELSTLLYVAFQEQQLNYWNTSYNSAGVRWKVFANALGKAWNVTTAEGWDEDECKMARLLYHAPDRANRASDAPYNLRACLIDVDVVLPDRHAHVGLLGIAVLIGTLQERQAILTFSLTDGYSRYDSLDELGKILPGTLDPLYAGAEIQWRLYEPHGNYFESLACTLIGLQVEAIGLMGDDVAQDQTELPLRHSAVSRIMPSLEDLSDEHLSRIFDIHQHLPDWLTAASDADMAAYSRLMIDLAELNAHWHGRAFNDGIAPIRDYAREQLQSRINARAQDAPLNLDKVQIEIRSPVIWGSFPIPGAQDITRRNLIDLALENLTGLPIGVASVTYNGGDAPQWLSYDYLKEVIEGLDIGATYPALIKQKLLDDPQQSAQRSRLYTAHLRVQLPLLALQLKLQRRNGLDERGFRYVAAVMQTEAHERNVDAQPAVIRRLAFAPRLRPGNGHDIVANMYVIEPKDPGAGPCILYRPLLEPMLLQFPSRQNLLYAIKQDPALRESVLAWLPEEVRFNYTQYVFPDTLPSPWTAARLLVEPATVLQMSGPIDLSNATLGDDALDTLFSANAKAMVELATRQSVSNVKKRWDTFRRTGWQLLTAVLPFLGRTLGIAAWIWQIMDDLEQAERVVDTPQAQAPWTALVDMLLNVGMALTLHITLRHPPSQALDEPLKPLAAERMEVLEETEKPPVKAPAKVPVKRQSDVPDSQLPPSHQGPLNVSGPLHSTPTRLATLLSSFAVPKPEGLGEQNTSAGTHLYLYPLSEKWYAPVAQRWFEVTLDANDNVMVVDPREPTRTGPLLVNNRAGQWFIDSRLRLRGGGFRNRRRTAQEQKPSRIESLRKELIAFSENDERTQSQLYEAQVAIGSEPGPSTAQRREAFISQADERVGAYDTPIRQLRALSIIDTVPNYQSLMSGYLNKQLILTRSVIEERVGPFRDTMETTMNVLDPSATVTTQQQVDQAQAMSSVNVDMIRRMEYVDSRYRELGELGVAGADVIQRTRQRVPNIQVIDLKALQITVARFLCVALTEDTTETRRRLNRIIDDLDISIQSFIELLGKVGGVPLDQRIEVLNSMVEQFALGDQRLLDLHADAPQHLLREPLETLRGYINDFQQQATQDLVRLLRERRAMEPKPGPSRSPTTPQRKVIKTRYKGVIVGEPREADSHLVDIKAPLTGKVIATFHEKTPGVWLEHEPSASRPPKPESIDLDTSLNSAQDLLDAEPAESRRILNHSRKAGCIPVEIEEMFHQYAMRLEMAADQIEEALTQRNLIESDRPSAVILRKALADHATRLFALGTDTRINMTKQQPPTAARLEWLHHEGQVAIRKTVTRRRLKGPGKDYLDEYEIRGTKDNAVLWYAHFHYPSPQAADEAFGAAHLKTREQQKLGGAVERKDVSARDQIAIYRSEISPALAGSLFFPQLKPAAAPGASKS